MKKSLSTLGIVVLFNAFAFAGQSTTAPPPAGPTVKEQPAKAPPQKQRLKKHRDRAKKPVTPPKGPATPPPQSQ